MQFSSRPLDARLLAGACTALVFDLLALRRCRCGQAACVQPVVEQGFAQRRMQCQPAGGFQAVRGRIAQYIKCRQPLCLQRISGSAAKRGAVHDLIHGLWPVSRKPRQNLEAQMIARQPGVAVGRIVDAAQLVCIHIVTKLFSR